MSVYLWKLNYKKEIIIRKVKKSSTRRINFQKILFSKLDAASIVRRGRWLRKCKCFAVGITISLKK